MFLTARLWEGSGWTVGELERCAFASPPSVYQEKGFIVHHRVLKGMKKTDRQGLHSLGGRGGSSEWCVDKGIVFF